MSSNTNAAPSLSARKIKGKMDLHFWAVKSLTDIRSDRPACMRAIEYNIAMISEYASLLWDKNNE